MQKGLAPLVWVIVAAVLLGGGYTIFARKDNGKPARPAITENMLNNTTLSYLNPYTSKNETATSLDTFTLIDGRARLGGVNDPRIYYMSATAIGDLDGDGKREGAIGLIQGWGANRRTPIVFVLTNKNGVFAQIDSVLPDPSVWNDETSIQSLSIQNGILSVHLLVLGEADKKRAHYVQRPTVKKTVQFKLVAGKLVSQDNAEKETNQPSITVLSPNGGEQYKAGDKINVRWNSRNIPPDAMVKIYFTPSGFNVKEVLGYFKNTGSYIWTLNDPLLTLPERLSLIVEYDGRKSVAYECYGEGCDAKILATDSSDSPFTIVKVDTTNWKTYRNEKYGFDFRYPSTWRITTEGLGANALRLVSWSEDKEQHVDGNPGGRIDIYFVRDTLQDRIKTFLKAYPNVLSQEQRTVDGRPSIMIENIAKSLGTLSHTKTYLVEHSGNVYHIILNVDEGNRELPTFLSIFETFIATFTFTN